MSNALAIQVVTKGLIQHLTQGVERQRQLGLPELSIDFKDSPPHLVKPAENTNVVNLFLYHVAPNAAWRNMTIPGRSLPGEAGQPPLALNLYYLITVFAVGTNEHEHHVLGRVMSVLHDNPFLLPDTLKELALPGGRTVLSGLAEQIERVKLTMVSLSLEDMTRLWSGFQTNLRLSVAYEASVVLIESLKPIQAPLPVLSRGAVEPDGFEADANMTFPTLTSARFPFPVGSGPPRWLDGGRITDTLVVAGQNLADPTRDLTLVFQHAPQPPVAVKMPRDKVSPDRVLFAFPDNVNQKWASGFYTLFAQLRPEPPPPGGAASRSRTTNAVTFALRPDISGLHIPNDLGAVKVLKVPVKPVVRNGQKVSLLLDDLELQVEAIKEDISTFWVWYGGPKPAVPLGELLIPAKEVIAAENQRRGKNTYLVRLRVDGVDSLLFNPASPDRTLKFDDLYRKTLVP